GAFVCAWAALIRATRGTSRMNTVFENRRVDGASKNRRLIHCCHFDTSMGLRLRDLKIIVPLTARPPATSAPVRSGSGSDPGALSPRKIPDTAEPAQCDRRE